MSLPGQRLHRFLATRMDPARLRTLVEPAIADLQYESGEAADHRWRRVVVLVRGYAALARLLVVHGMDWPARARRAGMVIALGALGGVLWVWTRTAGPDARPGNGVLLVFLFAAPNVLRLAGAGATYRSLFVNTVCASALMLVGRDVVAFAHPMQMLAILGLVAGLSAVTVTTAWSHATGQAAAIRNVLTRVLAAGAIMAAVFGVRNAVEDGTLSWGTVGMLPFFTFFFSMFLATSLPVLLGARPWIRRRLSLAVLGVVCSPIAMAASTCADAGRPADMLVLLRADPAAFALGCLPFIAGSAALGWMLVRRDAARVCAAGPQVPLRP